ncbi:MAG: hypothetical protein JSV67_06950 [Thermoplasmatales archaeon]|nr:MAG: hypothetical protein JSV67_06950 [Thermoplasmatales archaeon]
MKKMINILISLMLVITALSLSVSAGDENSSIETVQITKTVTFYRHSLDGSITPITVDISLKDGQNLEEILVDTCSELLDNDEELQKLLQDFINDDNTFVSKVKSRGKGFHFKMKIRYKLGKGIKLFPLLPPYFIGGIKIPLIYCRYLDDVNGNTSITPLMGGDKETIYVEGAHTVFALGFIGYTSWFGRVSLSPFDILPRMFTGYALLAGTM